MNGHLVIGEASSGLILLIGVFVLVGLTVAAFAWKQEKKRTEQVHKLMEEGLQVFAAFGGPVDA